MFQSTMPQNSTYTGNSIDEISQWKLTVSLWSFPKKRDVFIITTSGLCCHALQIIFTTLLLPIGGYVIED